MFMTALMAASLFVAATPETMSVVTELAHEPRFTSEAVGYGATRSNAYELYSRLIEVAGDDELRALLAHESPVVRLYAFQGLIERGLDAAPLIAALSETESFVDAQFGCMGERMRVGELAKQIVDYHDARQTAVRANTGARS